MDNNNYIPPMLEVIFVEVEKGFAASGVEGLQSEEGEWTNEN